MNRKTLLSNFRNKIDSSLLSIYRSTTFQLLTLALPILAAQQIGALIPFINTFVAGRKDPLWLAATGLANNAFISVMGFGWGIITIVGIQTANQLGKTQDTTKTGIILKASFLTSAILSVPIMIMLRYMQPLWVLCGQSPEIAALGQSYLNGFLWIVFADFAKFSIFQFAIAHHHIIAPLVATIISIPLIYLSNFILIPRLGIYGLGLGTALSYWVVFLALWAYCYKDKIFSAALSMSVPLKTYPKLVWHQFALGAPIGAMSTIELLFALTMSVWAGRISTNHLIAHQIAMQWLHFTIMGAVSFSEAITIKTARAYAQSNLKSVREFLRAGVGLAGLSMTLISCLYWFIPKVLIQLDLGPHHNDPSIIHTSTVTLALCGAFQIFDGVRIALSGALRGLSDTQYPMWVTLFAFWGIGLPIACVCTFIFNWQQFGLWLGMTLSVIAMTGLQYARMRKLIAATE